jgi:predicted kinase
VPFTVKLRRDTNNQIYELADQLECGAIAEVIEMALQALTEKIARGEPIR